MASGENDQTMDHDLRSIECPVCLRSMVGRKPRALSCLHTFCESCLKTCSGGQRSVSCPSCRKVTKLPEGGVTVLPINFFISQMADKATMVGLCQYCPALKIEPKESTNFCRTCKKRLCKECKTRHTRIAAFTDHEIITLKPKAKSGLNILCDEHNTNMTVYCNICKVFACDVCAMMTKHKGHETDLVNARIALDHMTVSLAPEMCTMLTEVGNRIDIVTSELQKLETVEQKIREEGERKKSAIDREVESMVRELHMKHQGPVLDQICKLSEVKEKLLLITKAVTGSTPRTSKQLNSVVHHRKTFDLVKGVYASMPSVEKSTPSFKACSSDKLVGALVANNNNQGCPIVKRCTICKKKISGAYFKCGMCRDFIKCVDCDDDHDKLHAFLKIRPTHEPNFPKEPPLKAEDMFAFKEIRRRFNCDNCGCVVGGTTTILDSGHYKCGNCPDFDLCDECEALEGVHDKDHIFIKLSRVQSKTLKIGVNEAGAPLPLLC